MRLWSLNPALLDTKGLVALWREALGAQKALIGLEQGQTVGYQSHPQLDRFKATEDPVYYIGWYLWMIWCEANSRHYNFNVTKIDSPPYKEMPKIPVGTGQLDYEYDWLYTKVKERAPEQLWRLREQRIHPVFMELPGGIEDWERVK